MPDFSCSWEVKGESQKRHMEWVLRSGFPDKLRKCQSPMPSNELWTLHPTQAKVREKGRAGCFSQLESQREVWLTWTSAQNRGWGSQASPKRDEGSFTQARAPRAATGEEGRGQPAKLVTAGQQLLRGGSPGVAGRGTLPTGTSYQRK